MILDHVLPRGEGTHRFDRLLHIAEAGPPEQSGAIDTGLGRGWSDRVLSGKTGLSILTLSPDGEGVQAPAGAIAQEATVEDFNRAIKTKLCLSHRLSARELWLYTVVCTQDACFYGARAELEPCRDALSGQALTLRMEAGPTWWIYLGADRTLICHEA